MTDVCTYCDDPACSERKGCVPAPPVRDDVELAMQDGAIFGRGLLRSPLLGNESADRAAMSAMITARICLERRKTHGNAGTFGEQAFLVYTNSHRFRRRGIDGHVWRFSR